MQRRVVECCRKRLTGTVAEYHKHVIMMLAVQREKISKENKPIEMPASLSS